MIKQNMDICNVDLGHELVVYRLRNFWGKDDRCRMGGDGLVPVSDRFKSNERFESD